MKYLIYLLLFYIQVLVVGCDYENSKIIYETSSQILYTEDSTLYIKSLYLIFHDSMYIYPNRKDTVKRDTIELLNYFNFNSIQNDTIDFDIQLGIKSTNVGFEFCSEKVFIPYCDTCFTFTCLGR